MTNHSPGQPLQQPFLPACLGMPLPLEHKWSVKIVLLVIAKADDTSNPCKQFHEMTQRNKNHTGSIVPRVNKARAGHLLLRGPAKNMLGCKDIESINLAEWNVRTLLDKTHSGRPERQTALVALELGRYNIDIAALSET